MNKIKNYFFEEIDNSGLVVFRILLGFLLTAESLGAILTGWVQETFGDTPFNFTAIGLEWLQLPVFVMYLIYGALSVLGIFIMLGFKYQVSTICYFLLWTFTYFLQKTHYNNHYYLMILISGAMIFVPANRFLSLDAKKNPALLATTCQRWTVLFFILQIWIVYTYASIHKIYPDWLAAKPIHIWFMNKADYPSLSFIKPLLISPDFQQWVAYIGIGFDGLIIPALLWRRTRWIALFFSICFHLFNSLVFQIGVFPYLSLAFLVFFFAPENITNRFFRSKPYILPQPSSETSKNFILACLFIYFSIQLILPIRHHWIEGNVFWTEEGHKMSWRMMLRSKTGNCEFTLKDVQNNTTIPIDLKIHFTQNQINSIVKNPDMIWQAAQYFRKYYEKEGIARPEIYVNCMISLNGSEYKPLINNKIDLAHTPWLFFSHNPWIYSYDFEK